MMSYQTYALVPSDTCHRAAEPTSALCTPYRVITGPLPISPRVGKGIRPAGHTCNFKTPPRIYCWWIRTRSPRPSSLQAFASYSSSGPQVLNITIPQTLFMNFQDHVQFVPSDRLHRDAGVTQIHIFRTGKVQAEQARNDTGITRR